MLQDKEIINESISLYNKTLSEIPEDLDSQRRINEYTFDIQYPEYLYNIDYFHSYTKFSKEEYIKLTFDNEEPIDGLTILSYDHILQKYHDKVPVNFEIIKELLLKIIKKDYALFPVYKKEKLICFKLICYFWSTREFFALKETLASLGYKCEHLYVRRDFDNITNLNKEYVNVYQFNPIPDILRNVKKYYKGLKLSDIKTYETKETAPESLLPVYKIDLEKGDDIFPLVIVANSEEDFNKINLNNISEIYKYCDRRIVNIEEQKNIWKSGKEHKFWKPMEFIN